MLALQGLKTFLFATQLCQLTLGVKTLLWCSGLFLLKNWLCCAPWHYLYLYLLEILCLCVYMYVHLTVSHLSASIEPQALGTSLLLVMHLWLSTRSCYQNSSFAANLFQTAELVANHEEHIIWTAIMALMKYFPSILDSSYCPLWCHLLLRCSSSLLFACFYLSHRLSVMLFFNPATQSAGPATGFVFNQTSAGMLSAYAFVKIRAVGQRSCQDGSCHLIQDLFGAESTSLTDDLCFPFTFSSRFPRSKHTNAT